MGYNNLITSTQNFEMGNLCCNSDKTTLGNKLRRSKDGLGESMRMKDINQSFSQSMRLKHSITMKRTVADLDILNSVKMNVIENQILNCKDDEQLMRDLDDDSNLMDGAVIYDRDSLLSLDEVKDELMLQDLQDRAFEEDTDTFDDEKDISDDFD